MFGRRGGEFVEGGCAVCVYDEHCEGTMDLNMSDLKARLILGRQR